MTYDTVIITPNADTADAINMAYHSSKDVQAFSIWSIWSGRANKIVVFPIPQSFDEDMRYNFEASIRENALCRLVPGGEMIRL